MIGVGRSGCPPLVLVLVIVIVVVHVHDLATAVEPAMRAHAVGTARPVALRAAVDRGRGDLVLRPPLRGARVRLLLLRDGHSRRERVANSARSTDPRGASPPYARPLADRPGPEGVTLQVPGRSTMDRDYGAESSTGHRWIRAKRSPAARRVRAAAASCKAD